MRKLFIFMAVIAIVFAFQLKPDADHQDQLLINSEAAIIMETETGAVLYAKNAEQKMYPASLTKIATAIYAIENGNLQDPVIISRNAVNTDGTRVYLEEGEVVTLQHLIQGMLINSGNDASTAIAEHINGNTGQFSENLNQYLEKKIGVTNTHFTNPSGLFDENHFTTAEDMAKITNYAMKNNTFKEIFGTKELQWDGDSWKTTLITHHQMLKGEIPYSGITGGKTGFVNESKQTLATTADNGQLKLTAILLKAEYKKDIYKDTKQLLDYGFQNFKNTFLPETKTFSIQDKEFKPAKAELISEPITGAKYTVSKDGILKVQIHDHATIQTIQLMPIENKIGERPVSKKPVQRELFNRLNALYGTIAVIVSGAVFSIINRNRN